MDAILCVALLNWFFVGALVWLQFCEDYAEEERRIAAYQAM